MSQEPKKGTLGPVELKLIAKHGFGPCSHPDCGGAGDCATDHFHRRAKALVAEVLRAQRRKAK